MEGKSCLSDQAGWVSRFAIRGFCRRERECFQIQWHNLSSSYIQSGNRLRRDQHGGQMDGGDYSDRTFGVGILSAKPSGMNDRDLRRYDRATRVQSFGRANAADFAVGAKALTHFTNIDVNLSSLDRAKAGQTPARVSKATLLDALALDLTNIARTAGTIERNENGFAAPYRLPGSPSESALTTHADSVLLRLEDQADDSAAEKTAKAALRAQFTVYELPADFVAQLRAGRQAIAEANQHNDTENLGGVENTELISQLLSLINDDVVELNTIMHNKYARQPEKASEPSTLPYAPLIPFSTLPK